MITYNPKVEKESSIWNLSGDWTRDIPVSVREEVSRALEGGELPQLVDLTAVKFVDSWGERKIADLCQRMKSGTLVGSALILTEVLQMELKLRMLKAVAKPWGKKMIAWEFSPDGSKSPN